MKSPFKFCLVSAVTLALGVASQGQTIDWGSPDGIDIVDSSGNVLDNTFIFELGAFTNSFVPEQNNYNDWFGFWKVFDRADYNQLDGTFASSVLMQSDGTSNSAFLTPGAGSFEGLDAYIWIRNSDDPIPGSEWFLVRAESWVFPEYDPDCCGGFPLKWSISDLTSTDVPEWGSQSGIVGPGVRTDTDVYEIQTHTFVPEPSSLMLVFLGSGLLMRRRRPA